MCPYLSLPMWCLESEYPPLGCLFFRVLIYASCCDLQGVSPLRSVALFCCPDLPLPPRYPESERALFCLILSMS